MSVYGDLRTLSLTDLLRWASSADKTGVLELERNGVSRSIEFRAGHVGSCSSNHPSSRLGQFLLSRERINEIQLQHLLTLQASTGKRLGLLLVELGLLSRSQLASEVASKAQETIYGLFDWDDAFFRFDDGATLDPDQIEVNLSVDKLIADGQTRTEQLARIREAFESSGVVLGRTGGEIPEELLERTLTRRTLDAIDGRRTIAEVLLHTRASEFVVLYFLHRLHERGLLEIREVRPLPVERPTLLDTAVRKREDSPLTLIDEADLESEAIADASTESGTGTDTAVDLAIEKATRLIGQRDYETAVEVLRTSCREHSTDYARRLLLKAESSLVSQVWQDASFSSKFPVMLRDKDQLLAEEPAPDESFLLSLIDGITDLQAILWLAPMREVDVIIALQRMIRKGMIELAEPADVGCLPASPAEHCFHAD
jgi:hypothetical protein